MRRLPKLDRNFTIELVDAGGTVHAVVEKLIHVSRRMPKTDRPDP